MKTAMISRCTYPNAASWRYHLKKGLDILLAIATTVGAVTALIFLMLL